MTKDAAAKTTPKVASNPPSRVANPYAQKKKSQTTSSSDAKKGKTKSTRNGAVLAAVDIGPGASFSEAFSNVEETSHYQKEIASWKQASSAGGSGVINEAEVQARAQQRAFDASAAAEAGVRGMSDRDHHVMLQPHVLHVSEKQRGNGVLKFIRNVPFSYSKMVPDYIMSSSRCALFLSCKYHSLYPSYIKRRIDELKTDFALRILLLLVDVEDNANTLLELNRLAVIHNMTLVLAWSEEEAARYLETYKAFDGKDASSIQKREQTNFCDQMADVLGTVRSVNKTDSAELMTQFSSLKSIAAASVDQLAVVDGMGPIKIRRLHDALHKPFSSRAAKRRKEKASAASTVATATATVILEETNGIEGSTETEKNSTDDTV